MSLNMKNSNSKKASFVAISFLSVFALHPMTSFLGIDEDSDERYMLNALSYSYGSNRNYDDQTNNRLIKRMLVSLAIEISLLNIGKGTLATVINQLSTMYHCSLVDCYEHPDYLSVVLKTRGNNVFESSVNSIKVKLKEFEYDKEISAFLYEVSK